MPRLAIIAFHTVAVAVLVVVAYKLLLEPGGDGAGGISGEQAVKGESVEVSGKRGRGDAGPARAITGRDGSGRGGQETGPGPSGSGSSAAGAGGSLTPANIRRSDRIRAAGGDPTAVQYGDALELIKGKLKIDD
jgi:hypothetical protein